MGAGICDLAETFSVLNTLFQAQHALADLANVAGQYDMDGIDVHFLNHTDVEGQRLKVLF